MTDNKVTIDAAWFSELYARANEKYDSEDEKSKKISELKDELQGSRNCYYGCRDELFDVTKERDELKAKLDESEKRYSHDHERMDAAERCIAECAKHVESSNDALCSFVEIGRVIRTYREKGHPHLPREEGGGAMSMEYRVEANFGGIWKAASNEHNDICKANESLCLFRKGSPTCEFRLACREVGDWCECREVVVK